MQEAFEISSKVHKYAFISPGIGIDKDENSSLDVFLAQDQ